jgi:Cu(I)/Ag(I) efflux system membrane fusion protein
VAQEKTSPADKASREAADALAAGPAKDFQVLTAEDRVAAKKQRICPVTGALLGSMGEPYKIKVKDRTVFLCCQGCAGAILQDPDKYLAKLKKTPAEK